MAFFSFAEGSAMFDSTPIENLFLMDYLPMAPEGFLRVYLYARMLALHPELGGDLAETARALHMEEEQVFEAFSYWERQGLVRRVADHPPTYELLPVRSDGGAAGGSMERDYYTYRDFNAQLQALFGSRIIESHEYRIANDWMNVLGYDQDAVLRLVQYGLETSRNREKVRPASVFKRIDRQAVAWADRGCRTAEDVEKAIAEDEKVYSVAQAVCKRFALRREPTLDELDCAHRWTVEWNYTLEDVLESCGETVKTSKPSFGYLDAVLKSRLGSNSAFYNELKEVLRELDNPQAQPTPDQLAGYARFRAKGFEHETVKLAAVQCHRRNKTRFEDLEWMLKEWGSRGLYARADAEAYIEDMQRKAARVRELLALCGLERRPSMNDLSLYEGWQAQHDESVIEYAAACARGMQVPVKYMDKLLTDWQQAGVRTVEEAKARHEATRAARAAEKTSERAAGRPAANPALDYQQREYRDEDFGDDFFIDLDKYGEGGDRK